MTFEPPLQVFFPSSFLHCTGLSALPAGGEHGVCVGSIVLCPAVWGAGVHTPVLAQHLPSQERKSHICFVFCLLQHPLQWLSTFSPIRMPFSGHQLLKLGLFLNCFFYGFVKDLSWLQTLYKIPLQLWFISSPFLLQYFRSGLNLLSLTSLHTFYIVLDRLHFIAGVLFLKAVDCDTIAKRKTFVKVQLVMHSYHPLKRFN